MNTIVSVTNDWGIGYMGRLLVRNKDDMRFFRQTTMGGTVICGRTTFQSFPGGALKGRRNIVLTRDDAFCAPGVEVVHTMEEALDAVCDEEPDRVWVIGGESVYRQLLSSCTRAFVTKHDVVVPADAFFPNLDDDPSWHVESLGPAGTTDAGIPYQFVTYHRK